MRVFLIQEPILLELLAYLSTKPMREVEPAVLALRNLQEAPGEIPAATPPPSLK